MNVCTCEWTLSLSDSQGVSISPSFLKWCRFGTLFILYTILRGFVHVNTRSNTGTGVVERGGYKKLSVRLFPIASVYHEAFINCVTLHRRWSSRGIFRIRRISATPEACGLNRSYPCSLREAIPFLFENSRPPLVRSQTVVKSLNKGKTKQRKRFEHGNLENHAEF